jgi:hypothetical protein
MSINGPELWIIIGSDPYGYTHYEDNDMKRHLKRIVGVRA